MMKQMQSLLVHKKLNNGFSLIEMVITVGIISIIIVALATMGIFTLKKASESNNKSRALRFAQEAVEGIRYYRDVNRTAFGSLQESNNKTGYTGVGNYVLEMGSGDVGWVLKTNKIAYTLAGSDSEKIGGCQDPVTDNLFKLKADCDKILEPYFKRKIEVIAVNSVSIDFKITVWWENGNDAGVKGKKVIVTTTLAK